MPLIVQWRYLPEDCDPALRQDAADLGHMMYACGIGPELSEKNLYEFWARLQILAAFGWSSTREWVAAMTRQRLRQHIGLRINCSQDSRATWIKRQIDGAIMSAQYDDRRLAEKETN